MSVLSKLGICVVGVCMICVPACRSSQWQSANDVAALQKQRREKVQKSVGVKQSEAELHLARDARTFGDTTACLSALDGILEREPGHVEALLLKAEVHLAKDELIAADRSIAIALSHDPSNTTAKRLSEIARTKQLAERPQQPIRPAINVEAAPLPLGAVSQVAYSPAEAGIALVDDARHEFPKPAPANLDPVVPLESPKPEPAFAPAELETASVLGDPPGFAEVFQPLHNPFFAAPQCDSDGLLALTETETAPESIEPPAPAPIEQAAEPIPVILRPDQALAYESSDVPAGTAEVTDQTSSNDSPAAQSVFLSAIGSADSVAALAAVEKDLIDNPNDPQIPISATVSALEANQPEAAASIARLGIAFHPSCAGLHRTLGAALYRSGSYSSSQVALQQALSLDNSSALSYFLMGCVSEKLGDIKAAEAHFAQATELDPTFADCE